MQLQSDWQVIAVRCNTPYLIMPPSRLCIVRWHRQGLVSSFYSPDRTTHDRHARRLCSLSHTMVRSIHHLPHTNQLHLVPSRDRQWIASGSFDRTIKLWDLHRTNQEPLITLHSPDSAGAKSSVYAVTADPYGMLVASGTPERVVRMWDPRSGKRIGKLVGHTDNIRAILISEDAKYVSLWLSCVRGVCAGMLNLTPVAYRFC